MKKEPSGGQKIKEKAAEKEAGVTLPGDFASSSRFCEDGQIKESDLSTGVSEGTGVPESFLSHAKARGGALPEKKREIRARANKD